MILTCFIWLLTMLIILLTVAFFTLFERNFMGLVHLRVGPTKVSFLGLLQPLIDALNLLSNNELVSTRVNPLPYHLSPHISLFLSLYIWVTVPMFYESFYMPYSFLVFMILGSIMVFGVLLGGWSSNSNYSLIGSLRSVAQSISYEAVFTTLSLVVLVVFSTYSFNIISICSSFIVLYILPIWVFTTLAETHRAPFDFSESESELVSGFNTEYGGVYFAFVFLSEYSVLIFSSVILSYIFFPLFCSISPLITSIVSIIFLSFFILIRVTFCRYRYDNLIISAWNSYLPVSLFLLIMVVFL